MSELIEQLAKLIYQQWGLSPNYVRWVEGGNSLNQDKARRMAKQFFDDNQSAAPIDNVARLNKLEWVLRQISHLPKDGSVTTAVFLAKEALIPDTQAKKGE
jgi:hypothetical protein